MPGAITVKEFKGGYAVCQSVRDAEGREYDEVITRTGVGGDPEKAKEQADEYASALRKKLGRS